MRGLAVIACVAMAACPDSKDGTRDGAASDAAIGVDAEIQDEVASETEVGVEVEVEVEVDLPPESLPILQRPIVPGVSGGRACTRTPIDGFAPPLGTFDLEFARAGATLLGLAGQRVETPDLPTYKIGLYPLDAHHTFAATPILEADTPLAPVAGMSLVGSANDVALAWHPYVNTSRAEFARIAPDGTVVVAPREVTEPSATEDLLLLRAPPSESAAVPTFFLMWSEYVGGQWVPRLAFQALDALGAPIGDVVALVKPEDGGEYSLDFDAVATDDGLLVTWSRHAPAAEVRYARFDTHGARMGEVVTLTQQSEPSQQPSIVRRAGNAGYVIAYQSFQTIRLAVLDAAGALVDPPIPLGPAPHVDGQRDLIVNGEPRLGTFGDLLTLTWAMPDNSPIAGEGTYPLQFLLLDGATLAPASNVVTTQATIDRDGVADGRLTHARTVQDGENRFFVSYAIVYHAGSGHGALTIDCPPASP